MAKLVGAGMMPALRSSQFIRFVWLGQAALYLATGIWPFVSMRSFQKVTGPKAEGWLVQTVGALVSVIGVVMGVAALRRRLLPELALLGMGAAGSLAGIDVTYVARGRLRPIYLMDAAAEIALILASWIGIRMAQAAEEV